MLTLGISAIGVALIPIAYRFTGSLDVLFPMMAGFAITAGAAALCLPRTEEAPAGAAVPVQATR